MIFYVKPCVYYKAHFEAYADSSIIRNKKAKQNFAFIVVASSGIECGRSLAGLHTDRSVGA